MKEYSNNPQPEELKKGTLEGQVPVSPAVLNPHKSKLTLVLLLILLLFLFGFGGFLLGKSLNESQNISLTPTLSPKPTAIPTTSPDVTANWKTYTSTSFGFTFKYPSEYNPPEVRENYLSLISPLNSNRGKSFELQNGELKIEIIAEEAKDADSPKKCWDDHNSGTGEITNQSDITISGVNSKIFNWSGLGTGQFICVIYNKQRYLINKYPLETTRQAEYDQILSTFKFTDSTQVDETVNWKTYTNSKFFFTFKYPEGIKGAANLQIDERPSSVLLFVPDTEGTLLNIEIISNETIETQYEKDKDFIKDLSSLEKTTLNGYQGYKATFPAMSLQAEIIYIEKGNYLFKIGSADLKIYQQILSTFKFID